jgi:hypothetical protein
MRKLIFAAPILGVALAACTVAVTPAKPVVSNVSTQSTFCTTKDTQIDIKFDLGTGGLSRLTRLDIYFTDEGKAVDASTPSDTITQTIISSGSRFHTYYWANTSDTDTTVQSMRAQAIIISPANKQIWVRGYNGSTAGDLVQATTVMSPSADAATCDPGAASVP